MGYGKGERGRCSKLVPLLDWLCKVPLDLSVGSGLELQLVIEYDRWPLPSSRGDRELEKDFWLSDSYMEIISDAVSRHEGRFRRSSYRLTVSEMSTTGPLLR